ncbi:MAG: GNAT family N-acetyltransferase [Bacteroidetes bacterium]|nr:GNAT family N-acetyltransferase [Bacteroidota bacterium]
MVTEELNPPVFSHVEPVLPVRDLPGTISYWQEVLGFTSQWTWGDPPDIGAVSWQTVHVQFYLQPEWKGGGCSVWIRLHRIESLYRLHQQRGAEIVEPLESKPWGMAQYTVREINGHYLCFAGMVEEREKSVASMPSTVQIIGRLPGIKEFQRLQVSVGWGKEVVEAHTAAQVADVDMRTERVLGAAIFGVVAVVSGEVVGCALLVGDGVSYYYVKDVMVHKNWQGRRIGTALMRELVGWLNKNARRGALVGLFTRDGLEPFYKQFGFARGFAMLRYM